MIAIKEFSFGSDSVARAYDTQLVPSLFEPWAQDLIAHYPERWAGKYVLDLATGTGVVSKQLAPQIGPNGLAGFFDIFSDFW